MVDLSKVHDCDKCHGKIVLISVDEQGNTYCGYCNQRVDYYKAMEKDIKKFMEKHNIEDKRNSP